MVFIDVEVTFDADIEVDAPVTTNLLEHVVEEAKTGLNMAGSCAVESEADGNISLFRGASNAGSAFSVDDGLGSLLPTDVLVQDNSLAADVMGQLAVGVAVTDDVAAGYIVVFRVVHVFLHHPRAGFAGRGVVLREVRVNEDVIEVDSLSFQGLQDEILRWPKGFFRECISAQPVLIAHHHELVVGTLGNKSQPAEHTRLEADFLQGVHLLVEWLFDQCAVAIDK